jgi:dihydrofolate reductase
VRPRVSLVAAVARNGVIGAGDAMPWRLSTDLKRFKQLTLGKPVIVGRKTFDAIGKPLPGRANIVVTRRPGAAQAGVIFAADLDAAVAEAARSGANEIMVIGGGRIYADAIGRADRLYITHVEATPEGDTHFPQIDSSVWRVVSSESVAAGEKDSAATTYVIYERIAPLTGAPGVTK